MTGLYPESSLEQNIDPRDADAAALIDVKLGSLEDRNRNLSSAYQELFGFFNLTKKLGSLKDLSALPDLTFEFVAGIVPFKSVSILLNDINTGQLQVCHVQGESDDFPEGMVIDEENGFFQWLKSSGKPVLFPVGDQPSVSEVKTNIYVPLTAIRHPIGLLVIQSELIAEEITQHAFTLLSILANQIAVSLDNGRLYADLNEKNLELMILSRDLEESKETLRTFNEELECRIKSRTDALRSANERLKELDRMKSEFLANMSHELKTPLNAIIGFSEVLQDGIKGKMNDAQLNYVSRIRDNGKDLLEAIIQILDLSRIESGKMMMDASKFSCEKLIRESISSIEPLVEKKNINVKLSMSGKKIKFWGDRIKIIQILNNLIGNAVKFTPEAGSIIIEVVASGAPENCSHPFTKDPGKARWVKILVSDSGLGVEEEYHEAVFERFEQVDGSAARRFVGTGLGLSIAKKMVELHNGSIWLESPSPAFEGGIGSTFSLILPSA